MQEIKDDIFGGEYAPQFAELLETGWDWGREDWTSYTMDEEVLEIVRPRINKKIEDRFYLRELNIAIPGRWKLMMKSKMNEIMDELGPVYNTVAEGLDLTGISYTRFRNVESDYPQAQLQTKEKDYASSATEGGSETVSSVSTLEALNKFRAATIAPDNEVLKRLDIMFSNTPYFL